MKNSAAIVDGDVVRSGWEMLLVGGVILLETELTLFGCNVCGIGRANTPMEAGRFILSDVSLGIICPQGSFDVLLVQDGATNLDELNERHHGTSDMKCEA